jgi:tetratricopeptide (TPR) repeat protein
MLKIEKTVFISYRRTNSFHARAIYQNLQSHGYDVFLDYENIDSGAFDQIILNQIRARAHFIVILTPSALERCTDPNDWLRREIETALDEKRNIVPLMFDGFNWGNMRQYLVGQMTVLDTYNALDVPANYFEAAMERLRTKFLAIPIDAVLHPTSPADKIELAKMPQVPYEPVVDTNKLRASEYFERAYQHGEAGRYDDAIRDYTEAIRLNPQDAIAYNNRGVAYKNKGDYDRAIADYTEAIRLNPQYANAYYNQGIAYSKKGDYDRAIANCTEAIRLNPQEALTYNNRGNAYFNKKEYNRAIADYDRALAINPNHELARENRKIAMRKKRWGF